MPYVVSTLSSGIDYVFYDSREDRNGTVVNNEKHRISINGGQGVADRRTLITPDNGVVTEISDADAEMLKTHSLFKTHEAAGFVRIVSARMFAEKTAKKMEPEDDGAQLTASDFGDAGTAEGDGLKINGQNIQPRTKGRSRKRK